MKKINKLRLFKILLTILVLIVIAFIIIYIFPLLKKISTPDGQLEFKQKINHYGNWGFLILFAMQFAQIFLFILPGEPIEILAGICYGTFGGTVFLMLSNLIITFFIFILVRKFGTKFVYSFCKEEQVKKIENSNLFKNSNKLEFTLFLLFFIPGTPKDLLVFVSGLLPIEKPYRFITLSTLARFPSIISSTLAGSNISMGHWKLSIIMYLTVLLVVLLILFIYNKFDKNNFKNDVIDIMKD